MPQQFLPLGSEGVSSFGGGICNTGCSTAKDMLFVPSFLWKLRLHTKPICAMVGACINTCVVIAGAAGQQAAASALLRPLCCQRQL